MINMDMYHAYQDRNNQYSENNKKYSKNTMLPHEITFYCCFTLESLRDAAHGKTLA